MHSVKKEDRTQSDTNGANFAKVITEEVDTPSPLIEPSFDLIQVPDWVTADNNEEEKKQFENE